MREYKLVHSCGQVYSNGNLEFSHDGNSLLSITGSRVNIYDLANSTCRSVTAQGRSDLAYIALSADQQTLLQVDLEGYAQLIQLKNDAVLSYLNFHGSVSSAKFSADGRFLAVALCGKLKLFEFALQNSVHRGTLLPYLNFATWQNGEILHMKFWEDYLITSSSDQTVRFCRVTKGQGYIPITLTGHRKPVLGCFPHRKTVFSVSEDARVFVWK